MSDYPHRRYNPLTGDWVLVSPHRTERPWLGQIEKRPQESRPSFVEDCYLCPGNSRAGGIRNPNYNSTFVFTNDYSALLPDTPSAKDELNWLFRRESEPGICRVVCFSPRHDLTLPEMTLVDIRAVVDVWAEQLRELGQKYRWVQIFENKGSIMGCSNPHPHGQIWSGNSLPNEPEKENNHQQRYFDSFGKPLLLEYLEQELVSGERIVLQNLHWVALVPYWAVWPYEILLMPRQHILRFSDLSDPQRDSLAEIMKVLLVRYDNLFQVSFPYSMGWHGAPNDDANYEHWQLHAHYYPPLLRSATVKKFMVGYEMLAEPQRDLTPEQAAQRLINLPEIHYLQK